MIFFSSLLGSSVVDRAGQKLGKLEDIALSIKMGEYDPLLFLAVNKNRKTEWIPYQYVENLGEGTVNLNGISERIPRTAPNENFNLLRRDVLDQQIIDVEGARVVRVNDLQFSATAKGMSVVGIDISTKGLLRRLGVDRLDLFNRLPIKLIDWKDAYVIKGTVQIQSAAKQLVKLHPADLANIIEDLSIKKGGRLMQSLDRSTAARVLQEVEPKIKKLLVEWLGPERAAKIGEEMSIDDFVDLVQLLPRNRARELISYIQNGRAKHLQSLLHYQDDAAGGLMNTEFISVRPNSTASQTIDDVRRLSENFRSIYYLYVTDEQGTLRGVLSLRRLMVAKPTQTIKEIMKTARGLPVLSPHQSLKVVAHQMTKYNLNSIAVIDKSKKMLGVVTIDDVMRAIFPSA
jgi:magnesium transporter